MAPLFSDLKPMLLTEERKAFSDPAWLFEIKNDGFRLLAETDAGRIRLKTRGGADATKWFPELASLTALGGRHIFDGEVVVQDEYGRSDFNRLQDRARRRRYVKGGDSVVYIVFDLLAYRGESTMELPLLTRKKLLEQLLSPGIDSVLYLQHVEGQGEWLYQQAVGLKLEGVVGKRMDSVYLPGVRTMDWVKCKRKGWQEGRNWKP